MELTVQPEELLHVGGALVYSAVPEGAMLIDVPSHLEPRRRARRLLAVFKLSSSIGIEADTARHTRAHSGPRRGPSSKGRFRR
ncbi:hypothetical protein JCM18899A_09320 [Nocardioides sp. AN3]